MVNLISDYIPPFSPLPNIAPFTYKDGETYLSTLDRLRTYCNTVLVDFINTNFTELSESFTTEVNTLIAQVNVFAGEIEEQLASQNSAITAQLDAQNDAITLQLSNQDDDIDTKIAQFNSDITTTITNFQATINQQIIDQNAAVATQLSDQNDAVDNKIADIAAVQDSVVAGYVEDSESDTRGALDILYSGGGGGSGLDDAGVAALIENEESDTRGALDTLYEGGGSGGLDDAGIAALVADDESDTKVALDAEYIPIISGVNKAYINDNTNTPALLALDSASTNQGTIVIRQSGGRVYTGAPTAPGDAATKQYVDTQGASIPTVSTVMRRDGAGRSRVVDPVDNADIATKGYVDTAIAGIDVGISSVVEGTNIDVDNTDTSNPVVNFSITVYEDEPQEVSSTDPLIIAKILDSYILCMRSGSTYLPVGAGYPVGGLGINVDSTSQAGVVNISVNQEDLDIELDSIGSSGAGSYVTTNPSGDKSVAIKGDTVLITDDSENAINFFYYYINVKGVLALQPRTTTPPVEADKEGAMYWDSNSHSLKVHDGTNWKTVTIS